jgi:hypothetical protein
MARSQVLAELRMGPIYISSVVLSLGTTVVCIALMSVAITTALQDQTRCVHSPPLS